MPSEFESQEIEFLLGARGMLGTTRSLKSCRNPP